IWGLLPCRDQREPRGRHVPAAGRAARDALDGRADERRPGPARRRARAARARGAVHDVARAHRAAARMASGPLRGAVGQTLRRRFFDVDETTGRWRRFFDIDELAGVRQEDPEVFEATHRLVLALVAEGVVDGLRIDHPDGLADPAGYLQRLAARGAEHVWVEK